MFRRLLIASVALLLPFAGAATAQADEVASRCSGRVIEQPFAQFDDLADYFLAPDADGAPQELRIGTVNADEAEEWTPVAPLAIVANTTEMDVQFRFTAIGAGSEWLIDDVYVDPYKKG